MKELFFENPLPIYVALALAEILIAGLWHRGRTRRLAAALLIPPLLAAAAMTLDLLVVTDREKIETALKTIASSVERGDLRACQPYLADDFEGWGGSREGAIEAGERAWRTYGIRKVGLSGVKIEVFDSRASVTARSIVTYNAPGFGEGRASLDWTASWALRDGQWRIINVGWPRVSAGL
jgi:hypothetical protein